MIYSYTHIFHQLGVIVEDPRDGNVLYGDNLKCSMCKGRGWFAYKGTNEWDLCDECVRLVINHYKITFQKETPI